MGVRIRTTAYSFSQHLFIFQHVPGIEVGIGDKKKKKLSKSWMVPAIKKVFMLYQKQAYIKKKNAVKSVMKGTPKEGRIMFENVSDKQCLLFHLPSILCFAHSTQVVFTTPLRLYLAMSLVVKSSDHLSVPILPDCRSIPSS